MAQFNLQSVHQRMVQICMCTINEQEL